ncbi:GntR family transcriptional regulator [Lentilactobacillus otakiensis]|uniref:GntR family transcriptional regulator n=1 Tax=Lentilactobacillus otakiensis DSM 19908 = JCM 15040 TaxID=1423780 RepID=S4NKP2_9LACO|nr:GntR family transcriptional regulator [Lentilactobacillus otakiensis]KRL10103.1 GntR family transcriptional regulator [Lentilactobacillus otakiensis DSM 19908 = JCM 15040]MBZ3776359.1 GntR family transcriptional regulator [Lentilactobacillus otakiensis]MDV3517954.1 GntR family transcriptional regulator [Lentilactobacillus otakiensis]GAD16486.1 gntR family transcriptional regulator [Lentilactobacillus otakiensis DSM 19908 = JCM 15040]
MESLQDKTYNAIYSKIMNLDLYPGQQVSDKQFEEEIGVSRTPVREAMLRLRRDDMLYSLPQSGTYVTRIDLKKSLDARYARQLLESDIAQSIGTSLTNDQVNTLTDVVDEQTTASEKDQIKRFFQMDNQFHQKIYEFADKQNIWDWLLSLSTDLNRYRLLRVYDANLPMDRLTNEHREIIKAFADHDADKVHQLVYSHLNLMLSEQQSVLDKFPDYFTNIK